MYILQNTLHNLVRNKGRNLMVGAIILAIIACTTMALMINNTAGGVIDDYKQRFGVEVTLKPNDAKLRNAVHSGLITRIPPLHDPKDLIAYGASDYLMKAEYLADGMGVSEQLSAIDAEKGGVPFSEFRLSCAGAVGMRGIPANGEDSSSEREFMHKLHNNFNQFNSGMREVQDGGRLPEKINECVISTELLEKSGLSVGDTITVTSALIQSDLATGQQQEQDIGWELTIVGAYIDNTENQKPENAFYNKRNEILVTADTLAEKVEKDWQGINVTAKYLLNDPDNLPAFTAELREKGLNEIWDVTIDPSGYTKIVSPVQGLKTISLVFVIVVLIFGAIIIALLASIAIRERKYEIGVLRAMGMKKMQVALGLWLETLIITATCLAFGLGLGILVAQPATNMIIDQQVAAIEEVQQPAGGCPLTIAINASIVEAEPLKNLDVSLGWATIVQLIAISLLLSSLSGVISTAKITKSEPIKILMERD